MSLKKQLRVFARNHEQQMEEKKLEEERKKIRSQEDWDIIDRYLSKLLTDVASRKDLVKVGRARFIPIDCLSDCMVCPKDYDDKYIYLKNDSRLKIRHEDMKRFCKQHKLKLKYMLDKEHDFIFSHEYIEYHTITYLIGI